MFRSFVRERSQLIGLHKTVKPHSPCVNGLMHCGCLTKTLVSGPLLAVMDNVGCAVGAEQLQLALRKLERSPD